MKFLNVFYFYGSFLPSWIRTRIRIPNTDPDPLTQLNPDPIVIRIRIRNPERIYSDLVPKPQPGVAGKLGRYASNVN
jgi:hypothetical protein